MNVAVVPAAGLGKRLGEGCSKAYRLVGHRSMISHVLAVMEECELIHQIIIVVGAIDIEKCRQEIITTCNPRKPWRLVLGGDQRQQSVLNGLEVVPDSTDLVVIHDAARPMLSISLLQKCIKEAQEMGACIVGLPVRDTLKRVDSRGIIQQTIDRSCLWMVQTPQVFRYDLLRKAHQKALEDGFEGTDDAALVEHCGYPVKIIYGSVQNLKITYPEDIHIVGAWLADVQVRK